MRWSKVNKLKVNKLCHLVYNARELGDSLGDNTLLSSVGLLSGVINVGSEYCRDINDTSDYCRGINDTSDYYRE